MSTLHLYSIANETRTFKLNILARPTSYLHASMGIPKIILPARIQSLKLQAIFSFTKSKDCIDVSAIYYYKSYCHCVISSNVFLPLLTSG